MHFGAKSENSARQWPKRLLSDYPATTQRLLGDYSATTRRLPGDYPATTRRLPLGPFGNNFARSPGFSSFRAFSSVFARCRALSSIFVQFRVFSSVFERFRAFSGVFGRFRAFSGVFEGYRAVSSGIEHVVMHFAIIVRIPADLRDFCRSVLNDWHSGASSVIRTLFRCDWSHIMIGSGATWVVHRLSHIPKWQSLKHLRHRRCSKTFHTFCSVPHVRSLS